MNGPIQNINSDHWKKYLRFLLGFVFALKIFLQYSTLQILLHSRLLLYSSKTSFMRLSFLGLGRQKIKRYYTLQKKLSWQISYTYGFVPNFNIFPPKFYKFNNHSQQKSWAFWTYTINIISVQKKIPIMQMRIFNTPNIVYILIKFILAKLLLLFVLWAFWLLLYAVWNLQNGVSLSLLKISSTEAQYFLKIVFL